MDYNKTNGTNKDDVLRGSIGADTMTGGGGNDVYYVDNTGDKVIESGIFNDIRRVNTTANGKQASFGIRELSFSSDGTKVAFSSWADNLVDGDTNGDIDIFVKDLVTGDITRVSTTTDGQQVSDDSGNPSFSADGTKVLFTSRANELSGDTNYKDQLFIKDLITGDVTLVSTDEDGQMGNHYSDNASFSSDGTKVIFDSWATNLTNTGDSNKRTDVLIKDLITGEITHVSKSKPNVHGYEEQANRASYESSMSSDGTKAIFSSDATNLVNGDTNNTTDIFVKDLVTGDITRINTNANGEQANAGSNQATFSADGTKVIFSSDATNLVNGDTNDNSDIFIKDLVTGDVTRVNTDANGQQAHYSGDFYGNDSSSPILSTDGTKVVFSSYANNLVDGDTNGESDIFVKDLVTGAISRINTDIIGKQTASSMDPFQGRSSYKPSFSADGTKVIFSSTANDLVDGDTNYGEDIFVVDLSNLSNGGTDTVNASINYTLTDNVENLTLIDEAVKGTGNELDNIIIGNVMDNSMAGQRGDDKLFGGLGNDELFGGLGTDTLIGGLGRDILSGGEGNDTFVYQSIDDTDANLSLSDIIQDFVSGNDVIDLSAIDANTELDGNQAFDELLSADDTFSKAGQLQFKDGVLYGNNDNDTQADFVIQVNNTNQLLLSDFVL